jgi:DNA-binding PadR family transcriptional regulator
MSVMSAPYGPGRDPDRSVESFASRAITIYRECIDGKEPSTKENQMHEFHEGRERGHDHQNVHADKRGRRFRAEIHGEREPRWRGGMSPRRGNDPREGVDPRETRRAERHERRGHRHEHRGRGRAQRGDVRAAVLLLLAEEPMHGYQMMHAIGERTGGTWRVSPGAIYPTIAQLEDEGLVHTEIDGGRKLVVLTDAGRAYVESDETKPNDPFAAMTDDSGPSGRDLFDGIITAFRTIARTGTPTQRQAARAVLEKTRRDLYLILADDPGAKTDK